ncbi:MAG: DUF2071 domain-containing protein [Gemmatimonadetes bacterium]|nr:DUF2071 domain-containing protein [Gemmatimonadota bacterium]
MNTADPNRRRPVFLTAWWRNLVMLNYEVDPDTVMPLVPRGIELDVWQGRALVSIVAFEFADVRVLNMPIPFHRDFEEINLRFYVRRRTADGPRRGVVFIRELVSLPAVALLARRLYGEPYRALPMARRFEHHPVASASPGGTLREHATTVRYSWRHHRMWHHVEATADTMRDPRQPEPASEEEFITDHTYGYGTRHGQTIEYVVEHPPWRYWNTRKADLDCDASTLRNLFGEAFAPYLRTPRSSFLVEGSPVTVRRPKVIRV